MHLQAQKKKTENLNVDSNNFENTIMKLEQQHKQVPNSAVFTELITARKELNTLLFTKIEGRLRFAKQKYHGLGNRASSLSEKNNNPQL